MSAPSLNSHIHACRERDKQRKQELQAAEKAEKRRGKQEERRLAGESADWRMPCTLAAPNLTSESGGSLY